MFGKSIQTETTFNPKRSVAAPHLGPMMSPEMSAEMPHSGNHGAGEQGVSISPTNASVGFFALVAWRCGKSRGTDYLDVAVPSPRRGLL